MLLLTYPAANNEGFIAPNGSAVAYAGEGGIAVALAPPRIEYRTVEIVKEEQKAKRESKRCYIVIRVVAIIIFCTVVAGTVRFRHSISEY